MRPVAALLAGSIALILFAPSSPPARTAEDPTPGERLSSLDWLSGHWVGRTGDGGTWESRYTGPEGGMILSVSKKIVRGKLDLYEFERFEVKGEDVVLIPYPRATRSSVHFTLEDHDPARMSAVFVNPEHDFPQRISYERKAPDRLVIEVTAERNGQQRGFRLDLERGTDR